MKYVLSGLLLVAAVLIWSCSKPEEPKAAKNLAGKIAGSYTLNTILSSDVKGTGSVTITAVNDTTVTVRQQTSLTIVSSGAVKNLDQNIDQGFVTLANDVYTISYPQTFSQNKLLYGNILLGNRLTLSRTVDTKSVTLEYIKK